MIAILVINYHKSDLTVELCHSLLRLSGRDRLRVVIIDNGTTAESQAPLMALKKLDGLQVDLLCEKENWGYFGGARRGLEFLQGLKSARPDWVIISNSDITFPEPGFIQRLAAMPADSDIGMLAPEILSELSGGSQNPYMLERPAAARMRFYKRVFAHPWTCMAYQLLGYVKSRIRQLRSQSAKVKSSARDIYAGHGSFMIFSHAYFSRGGDFTHGPFLFGEEVTIAETCRRLGLRIHYEPSLIVQHVEHATMGWLPSRKMLEFQREASAYCFDTYFASTSERIS